MNRTTTTIIFGAQASRQVIEWPTMCARRTTIEIDLDRRENSVLISIFNHGSEIEGDPEHIFQ